MDQASIVREAGIHQLLEDDNTAKLVINKNKVISRNTVPGLCPVCESPVFRAPIPAR